MRRLQQAPELSSRSCFFSVGVIGITPAPRGLIESNRLAATQVLARVSDVNVRCIACAPQMNADRTRRFGAARQYSQRIIFYHANSQNRSTLPSVSSAAHRR